MAGEVGVWERFFGAAGSGFRGERVLRAERWQR
jgi:hypothetical protein